MGRRFFYRTAILLSALLPVLSCKNPVSWNGDVEGFIEDGLAAISLRSFVFDSDGSAVDYVSPEGETIIRLNMINPKSLAAEYTLTPDDDTLFDVPPDLTVSDPGTLLLSVDPALAAEHRTLGFTLGIYVPSLNRTYPEQRLAFPCETAPRSVRKNADFKQSG